MRHYCSHCHEDLTCATCNGDGANHSYDPRDRFSIRCPICHGEGMTEEHVCADVFDEFRTGTEMLVLQEMLAHPDIEIPNRRRVETIVHPNTYVPPDARMLPVFAHHPTILGRDRGRRGDGMVNLPVSKLTGAVYFHTLCEANLIFQTTISRTQRLSLEEDWTPQYHRLQVSLEQTFRERGFFVLHRIFSGRVLSYYPMKLD